MKILGERLLVVEGRPPFQKGGTQGKIVMPELLPEVGTFWAQIVAVGDGPKTNIHCVVGDWIFCARQGGQETKGGRIISILDVLAKWEA